ncbi:MAG: hypothetical protein WD894_16060 [Pirellulales bacterium]
MTMAINDPIGNGAAQGSVLFVGTGAVLAQDNNGFYFDEATNTLKTKDQTNGSFRVSSGNITAGDGSSGSGTVTIDTGSGQPNSSGTGSAGNSGTVTLTTGPGGAASGGSAPGVSGNLLLKTGTGGGNAAASSTGGNAGHIILQPGSGGSGTSGAGSGGSTLVRASNSGDIFVVQNSAGSTTHLGVSNSGNLRVGTASSAALLQLGAGTATLPPLKLTAGTNLTSPSAGAVEWDGSKLWITSGSLRKELTLSHFAMVTDFGAKGDGSDDWQPVQDAVDSLALTGGVVYFPPSLTYGIGATVTISSQYPIWLVSHMGGWNNDNVTEEGYITPIAAQLVDGMFRWVKTDPLDPVDFAGGGGAIGLKIMQPLAIARTKPIHSAIRLDNGANFLVRDCEFYNLNGRVFYAGEWANNTYIQRIDVSLCGAVGKPMIDLQTTANQGYFFISDSELEISFAAPYLRVPVGGVYLHHVGFEADDATTPDQTFVDASAGTIHADNCEFRRNKATHVIIGQAEGSAGANSRIVNSLFVAAAGKTTKSLHVLPSAIYSQFSNLSFIGASTQVAQQIHIEASSCKLSDIYLQEGGNVTLAGLFCQATNVHCFALHTTAEACIKGVGGCSIVNCQVDGNLGATPTRGISVSGTTPKVIGCEVRSLAANKDGIITTSTNAVVADNYVYGLSGTGQPYVWANGALARNNGGYVTTASDGDNDDVITLNAESGVVETKSLTTLAGNTYTLQVNNALTTSSSRVLAAIQRGTETASLNYAVSEVIAQTGFFWVLIRNNHATAAFNGTVKVHFLVQN